MYKLQILLKVGFWSFLLLALGIPSCNAVGKIRRVEDVSQNYAEKVNSQVVQQIHSFSKSVLFYKAYASYFERADVSLPGFQKFFLAMSQDRLEAAQNLTEIVNQRGGYVFFQNVKKPDEVFKKGLHDQRVTARRSIRYQWLQQLCLVLSRKLGRFPHLCFFALRGAADKRKRSYKPKKVKPLKYARKYKQAMSANTAQKVTPKMPTTLGALEDALALERFTNKNLLDLMAFTIQMEDPAMRVKLDNHLERQVDVIYNLSNLVTRLHLYKNSDKVALGEYILDSELTY